jgi:hypothetical protein
MWKESYKIVVDSFYYSWNRNDDRVMMGLKGHVMKSGIECTFKIEHKSGQHKLEFPKAMIFDKTDPAEVALAVKNALVDYIKNSPEIPLMYRQRLVACVMTHHLQGKKNDTGTV